MKNKRTKKYLIILSSIILILFGIKVGYCYTYVGKIICTYPWEEFSIYEKAASLLQGFKNPTKQELYDQGLISKNQTNFKKFNDSYYKEQQPIECNFKKEELEKMYIKPTEYENKDINFTGELISNVGIDKELEQNLTKNCKTEEEKQEMLEMINKLDYEIIELKIDNTNVWVQFQYPKKNIKYDKWIKGKKLNISGKIEKVEHRNDTEYIYLSKENITIKQ